jgi:ArsR family transcriptional regulator
MTQTSEQAKFFKALTHPARLEILNLLRTGEECVCHMEALLGYRQAYISQQLAVLKDAGIIEDHRDGWNIFYRVVSPQIYELLDAARQMTGDTVLEAVLERHTSKDCPCPKCALIGEATKA